MVASLRLEERSAIDAFLVRAIETEDSDGVVLTSDDSRYATHAALATKHLDEGLGNPRETAAFVERRAVLALERLVSRYPTLQRVRSMSHWPSWVSWGVPLAGLALGAATNEFNGQRLNILAFPLLGILAWNVAVYLLILGHWLSHLWSTPDKTRHPLFDRVRTLLQPASARLAAQPTLERAIARFVGDWRAAASPLTSARFTRTLHVGAAMFAIGIIASMLLRARYITEYTAGWSGTWAGAESEIHLLLKIVLGPASAVTGIQLPSIERLRALRGGGENAGDLLKLWAVTAAMFVIIPRLILAGFAATQAARLARQIPMADDFYLRSVLRNALGRGGSARVVPYGFDPSGDARARLVRLLAAALGDATRVTIGPVVPYGDEDEWLSREGSDLATSDQLILLFDLASTPEAENQGRLVTGVREKIGTAGTMLLVLLDESSFRRKLRGQASAPRRVQERLKAWRSLLAASGVTPGTIVLDSLDEAESARILEDSLLSQRAST